KETGLAACVALVAWLLGPAPALAAPVRYGGADAELSVAVVSERVVQVVLAPLEKGKPRPAPLSTALVEQKSKVKLRCRELTKGRAVAGGKLRVRLKTEPLTLALVAPSGKVVQELTFTDADGSVAFRTPAPVLGLGEGGPQFDRVRALGNRLL